MNGEGRIAINACWNNIGVHGDASCPELTTFIHCRNCPVYAAAAVDLLDIDTPAFDIERRTHDVAQDVPQAERDLYSVVVFRVGSEWLALPTISFQEVAGTRVIHAIWHRRGGAVLGLTNIRGELLICISPRYVLHIEPGPDVTGSGHGGGYKRFLVIERDGHRLVFPVDEVCGVERYHQGDLTAPPTAAPPHITAVFPRHGKSVGVLDDQLLFHTIDRSLAFASAI
jgi:chemotaxis-related protein WspD